MPEPDIEIGTDDFTSGKDLLGRGPLADRLSTLVSNLSDPTVIALDGGWGTGKSVFLKLWAGHHMKAHEGDRVIYLDAFKHDFMEDPLIALTGALLKELPKGEARKNIKAAGYVIAKGIVRGGAALVTAGGSEKAGEIGAKAVEEFGAVISSEANGFWKAESKRLEAMELFRSELHRATDPNGDKPTRRVILIVDELDRCKPDFALRTLEVLKHLFRVEGVQVVLGTTSENSVVWLRRPTEVNTVVSGIFRNSFTLH